MITYHFSLSDEDLLKEFEEAVMGFEVLSDGYEENIEIYELLKKEILNRMKK